MTQIAACLYWYNRPRCGAEYVNEVARYVQDVRSRFFTDREWYVVGESASQSDAVAGDLQHLEQQVAARLPKKWAYVNDDPADKRFHLTSRSRSGFSSFFAAGPTNDPASIVLSVLSGTLDARSANTVVLRFPASTDAEVVAGMFVSAIHFWKPAHGAVSRGDIDDALDQPPGEVRVGWMTYVSRILSRPSVTVDLDWVSLEGGTLIAMKGNLPDLGNEDGIRELRSLVLALRESGTLAIER